MSQAILSKLSAVRRKQAAVAAGTGVTAAVGILVVALALEMFVDWLVEMPWSNQPGLPWVLRAAILAALLAGATWVVVVHVVVPLVIGIDDDSIALAVERDDPDFRGRLISAVQFSRAGSIAPGTSKPLVRALIRQTEEMTADRDFTRVVKTDRLAQLGAAATVVLVFGVGGLALGGDGPRVLLRRAFLSSDPVPRRTRVVDATGNVKVAKGDPITLSARAEGIKPRSGSVELRSAGAAYQFPMDADPDHKDQYVRKIDDVTQSFSYVIRLGDGRSDRFTVDAVDRPMPLSVDCTEVFPDYVHHADAKHLPGDLSLLAGSRLVIDVAANKKLKPTTERAFPFNRIHLAGSEKDYPLTVNPSDPRRATTSQGPDGRGIPLPRGTTGLSVYLVDDDNIESKDPTVYRVDLVPDRPPVVRITSADASEELVTRYAAQQIAYDAFDDYALGRIALQYRVDGGPVREQPVPLAPDPHPRSTSGRFTWNLKEAGGADKPLAEGNLIEYWLHAEDQNTVSNPDGKPGASDSDHFKLRVVSEEEKRKELMGRFGALPEQLTPIQQGQRSLSDQLGHYILRGATTQPSR